MKNPIQQKERSVAFLSVIGLSCIVIFCSIAGCIANSTSQSGSSPVPITSSDVIIPVDSPSSLSSTSNMQKGGVPASGLAYEGLVIKDLNGKFDPSLAESWNISSDAKTWTFHLVKNATWNDGVPFTCEDVKFTNDYMKSYNLTMGFVLGDVQTITCIDNYTAVFTLKTSYSGFLDQISHTPGISISPKHFWENITDPQHYQDTQFIGTGPFKFAGAEPGYFHYTVNDLYYGAKPKISGIILKVITNKDSQVLALKNGEIDVVSGITPAIAQSLAGENNIGLYTINDTGAYELAFNMDQYPANISAFRHAMSHAIDRKTVSSLFGTGQPTETTFLIQNLAGDYVNPAEVGMYDYNLTKAVEILAGANFTRSADGVLTGQDGKPVTVTIPLGGHGSSVDQQKIVTVIKNDWAKLGITVSTVSYDDQTQYRNAVNDNPVFFDGFPVMLHDDADAMMDFAHTPLQEMNYYNYNDSEYNSLVAEIQNTPDQTKIRQLAYRMQELLARDIPSVPVCTTDTIVAYRTDRFTGWDIGPGYHTILDPKVLTNLTPVKPS
ncbi:ABC transporter substrate-binding protein [Methanoregula sp.]|uniref:ABC transporter substrate-binding protein n=1 Tax=Methanoregula sp. TaxID=2052170 RepID=UPI003C724252